VLVLPAVDIRGGRCVRLIQGAADQERVYSDDPVEVARGWEAQGARWVHVVDLDGAFAGMPVNADVIGRLIDALRIPVQVGGGVRTLEAVDRLFRHGAARIILGTGAVTSPDFLQEAVRRYAGRIAVAIDARDGKVATEGWVTTTAETVQVVASRLERAGARRIIYTDIGRDGMLAGPNLVAFEAILQVVDVPVIASGGIAAVEDLTSLRRLEPQGLEGVIVGRALYEGRVRLPDLLAAAA
jgi:phosphoribosylformimino-5-aminoimidazole carboxamide ribotide isomerase